MKNVDWLDCKIEYDETFGNGSNLKPTWKGHVTALPSSDEWLRRILCRQAIAGMSNAVSLFFVVFVAGSSPSNPNTRGLKMNIRRSRGFKV